MPLRQGLSARIRETFSRYDRDRSGTIDTMVCLAAPRPARTRCDRKGKGRVTGCSSAQELNVAIKDLGINLTPAEEKSLLSVWDKNGDGLMVRRRH